MALADVLRKIFGSKSDRDMKAVKPVLDKVLAAYPAIDALSNDGLRAKTAELRARVMEVEAPFEERIAEIKAELEKEIPVSEKRNRWLRSPINWSKKRTRRLRRSWKRSSPMLSPSSNRPPAVSPRTRPSR